ncbi:polysaccharide pyruvyl transferase family protein [Microbacterium album]|uniref:Polysaccharide pyruvyl transferase domain-containing protein n=1 Tax=Microbacterium album TaxID=2053191 RepID=A0A917IFJ7_9MICO|nr:polysaccharide pyruvyl transferase family protein [Microbacterium album]GGH41178.1 hypothetical protein GCM10010921_13580 [Microbacterium album]
MHTKFDAARRVTVFAEHASANLGDQAISAALGDLLRDNGLDVERRSFTDYTICEEGAPQPASTQASVTPAERLRKRLAQSPTLREIRAVGLRSRLAATVRNADAVVVGGGALIQDNSMRFPIALREISRACSLEGIALFVAGVSVEGVLSPRARTLFGRSLRLAQAVYARDDTTARIMGELWSLETPVIGDFAAVPAPRNAGVGRSGVALNIRTGMSEPQRREVLAFLDRALAEDASPVIVFTTGVREDERAARSFVEAFAPRQRMQLATPKSLDELLTLLRQPRLVYPSRLHSAILGLREGAQVVRPSATDKVSSYLLSECDVWDTWYDFEVTPGETNAHDPRAGRRGQFIRRVLSASTRKAGRASDS